MSPPRRKGWRRSGTRYEANEGRSDVDTGFMMALERSKQRAVELAGLASAQSIRITLPVAVLAEWWRGGKRQERWLRPFEIETHDPTLGQDGWGGASRGSRIDGHRRDRDGVGRTARRRGLHVGLRRSLALARRPLSRRARSRRLSDETNRADQPPRRVPFARQPDAFVRQRHAEPRHHGDFDKTRRCLAFASRLRGSTARCLRSTRRCRASAPR